MNRILYSVGRDAILYALIAIVVVACVVIGAVEAVYRWWKRLEHDIDHGW